jgi:hypothetical protein
MFGILPQAAGWFGFAGGKAPAIVPQSLFERPGMEIDVLRRLHYAAAIASGTFAALVMHIVLTVLGVGLDTAMRDLAAGIKPELTSALAWWAIAAAGFVGGWGTAAYLIAAARGREFVNRLAQGFLVALVFAVATFGGIMSNRSTVGGTAGVIAGFTAVVLGLVCAYSGVRFAYLNAEQT